MHQILTLLLLCASVLAENLKVTTRTGTYIGLVNGTAPNVRQFLNVPYALPPMGSRRWLPPEHVPLSKSTLDATSLPKSCPQFISAAHQPASPGVSDPHRSGNSGSRSHAPYRVGRLFIVIRLDADGQCHRLPVIIFMTGGGFVIGGIDIAYQLPHHWVQRSQAHIVVSINYRVGIMGFPNAPGLASQNLGIMDQRMAHEWVRNNIEAFGGDPSRITLWGQSAGAMSTDYHSFAFYNDSIPTGLVLESGSALLGLPSSDFAQTNFTFVASRLGCGNLTSTAQIDCMRAKPVEEIVDFASRTGLSFVPIPDERVVFSNYRARYAKGLLARVPAIVGTTANEGTVLVPYTSLSQGPDPALAENETLQSFQCPARETSELRNAAGLATYRYQYSGNFSNLSPLPWLGAYHSGDLPLWFGTHDDFGGSEELEWRTSYLMQDYLLAFMKDPHGGLERQGWQDYAEGTMLRFGGVEAPVASISVQTVDSACYESGFET
ncbi:Alpha/Beta hydrolase protein [Aspergillus similis]